MRPIKNKKRRDPRYFLHEQEELTGEEQLEGPEANDWPGLIVITNDGQQPVIGFPIIPSSACDKAQARLESAQANMPDREWVIRDPAGNCS